MKELSILEISYLGLNPFAVQLLSDSYNNLRLRLPIALEFNGIAVGIASSSQALSDYMANALDPDCTSLVTTMCERDRAVGNLEFIKGNLEGILDYAKGSPVSVYRRNIQNVLTKVGKGPFSKHCWCGKCEVGS